MSRDPYRYFRVEARELVDQLGAGVLDLERGAAPGEAVARLLRHAHTLKGAARVVRANAIADLAHAIEDVLAPVRDEGAPVTRERIESLLRLVDAAAAELKQLGAPAAPPAAPTTEAAAPAPAPARGEEPVAPLRPDAGELDALIAGIAEAQSELDHLRRATSSLERMEALAKALGDELAGAESGRRARATASELRVGLAALARELAARVDGTGRELLGSREAAERLRLLPARLLFHALERTARDAAQSLGRPVSFEGTGGDIRLEGDVLTAVVAALVQAVRNAVAHGIEAPAARAAAGKPAVGRVALSVSRRGARVVFACRDDGAGVDLAAVRAAAEERGMPSVEARALGADDAVRLLLGGGLTTSRAVTAVSGRGVGLDLVRATAERLGGEATMTTEPGRGTTLALVVPVSVSSLEALAVEAAGRTVALPLGATRRTLHLAAGELARGPHGAAVVVGGEVVPFLPLERVLGAPEATRPRAWSVVLLDVDGASVAVGVDRLVGIDPLVLRPLPDLTPAHEAVLGVSLDGAGNPRLVLDPAGLVAAARRPIARAPAAEATRPRVLVVDDSLTTRMLEQSILESEGYEVDVAASGEEGLVKAAARRYGLFLVDVEMPGMDGFTFIERTRADAALRDVPAMLVTSRASPADRARGVAVGAVAHIEKSEFNQTDLLERIRALIG